MPIVNEELEKELEFVSDPGEQAHIRALWDTADTLMQDISLNLIRGKNDEVDRLTREALETGFSANTILDDGLIAGMAIVGVKFRDNLIFVPEVLVAARAMKAGMVHIEPILSASGIEPLGTVIMGTVKGDLHDIGKNLCIMMLRGAGFTVIDLGVDTSPEEFTDAVEENDAPILGMSALLTTTMPYMKVVIDELVSQGIRDDHIVLVGGAPLNEDFAKAIGADAYCRDAAVAVETAKNLIQARRKDKARSNAA